jgi:hypothetical protein
MGHQDARWLAGFEHQLQIHVTDLETGRWHPIETAPKYTAVLVCDGRAVSIAERCMGEWFALVGGLTVRSSNERLLTVKPTHWMPLPKLPTSVPLAADA